MRGKQSGSEELIVAVLGVANAEPLGGSDQDALDAAWRILWQIVATAGRDRGRLPGVPELYLLEEDEFLRRFPDVRPWELLSPCQRAVREFLDDLCVALSVEIALAAVVRCSGTLFFEPYREGFRLAFMPTDNTACELFGTQVLLSLARLLNGLDINRLQRCSVCGRFFLDDTGAAGSHRYVCSAQAGDFSP